MALNHTLLQGPRAVSSTSQNEQVGIQFDAVNEIPAPFVLHITPPRFSILDPRESRPARGGRFSRRETTRAR